MVALDDSPCTAIGDTGSHVRDRAGIPWQGCRRVTSLLVGALLLLSAGAQAQSLAAAAAKEKQRRKEIGQPGPAITERELELGRPVERPQLAPPVAGARSAAAPSVEVAEEPETLSEEEEHEDRLQAWRQMLQNAREDVARNSTAVDRLQAALSGLSGLYGSTRADRINQLEKAKQDLAASRRAVEELEDGGRHQGYR
jgi:DNA repair exonuclease SbcCD ATPase subunit